MHLFPGTLQEGEERSMLRQVAVSMHVCVYTTEKAPTAEPQPKTPQLNFFVLNLQKILVGFHVLYM